MTLMYMKRSELAGRSELEMNIYPFVARDACITECTDEDDRYGRDCTCIELDVYARDERV